MFADGVPGFPNSAGINSEKLASQMLETIGDHNAVSLKGHGIGVSEQTGEGNVVSAIRLERAACDQILLSSFSEPRLSRMAQEVASDLAWTIPTESGFLVRLRPFQKTFLFTFSDQNSDTELPRLP
jgi:hypothetical protein